MSWGEYRILPSSTLCEKVLPYAILCEKRNSLRQWMGSPLFLYICAYWICYSFSLPDMVLCSVQKDYVVRPYGKPNLHQANACPDSLCRPSAVAFNDVICLTCHGLHLLCFGFCCCLLGWVRYRYCTCIGDYAGHMQRRTMSSEKSSTRATHFSRRHAKSFYHLHFTSVGVGKDIFLGPRYVKMNSCLIPGKVQSLPAVSCNTIYVLKCLIDSPVWTNKYVSVAVHFIKSHENSTIL